MAQFASVPCTVLAITEWMYSAGSRFLEVPRRNAATTVACPHVRTIGPEAELWALVHGQQTRFVP